MGRKHGSEHSRQGWLWESAPFHFETTWRTDADAATVWTTLTDIDSWPRWWPGITSARTVEDRHPGSPGSIGSPGSTGSPGSIGPGTRARLEVRSALGFRLRFEVELQLEDTPRSMMFTASGDLSGVGHWSLTEHGPVTTVSILWCVTTTRPLIRLLRPLAPGAHALVMGAGNSGLNSLLSQSAS